MLLLVFQSLGANNYYLWLEAGEDITLCESENSVAINAQASDYSFVDWSTSGDGFFLFPNELSTYYYPGAGDVTAGIVILYITVLAADNFNLTDSLAVVIVKAPVSIAGDDATICESECFHAQGQAFFMTSSTWITMGDGYFTDPFIPNPFYFPGINDIATGFVDLCLVSFPILPCIQSDVSFLMLSISKTPLVDAGDDNSICKDDYYHLVSTIQHCNTIYWNSSGDGTFNNPNLSDPVYEPGYNDNITGKVVLTVSAGSVYPCQGYVSDSNVLSILNPPQIHAGFNQTICINQVAQLAATASNFASVQWTTYGDGTFDNNTILNPSYTPGQNDILVRKVFIEINAFPLFPCTETVGSYLFIELQNLPSVSAGENATVCTDSITLNGLVENSEAIIWSTSGDGTFSNNTCLNPIYFFGADDKNDGIVTLTLAAEALIPCTTVIVDETNLVIDIPHIVHQCAEDTTLLAGQDLYLHFEAESLTTGTYTWFFNGIEIPNENSPYLFILQIQPCNAGYYQCIYSDECSQVNSNICQLKIHEEFSQEFNLSAGWSGLSSFVIPDNSGLDTLFKNIIGNVILISDISGIYWPEHGINTLGTWLVPHGYQIKLQESSTLVMHGIVEYPVQEISVPPGWSLLPLNFNESVDVSVYFDTIWGIEIIKEVAGIKMYWPGMNIKTLGYLIPGKAYLIFNKTLNSISIDFSGSLKKRIGRK